MKARVIERAAAGIIKTIAKCGMKAVLHQNGKKLEFTAYIQPDINRNRTHMEEDWTAIGKADRSRWLYRGTAEGVGGTVKEGDIISCASGSFKVIDIEDYYFGDYPVYRSGWLEPVT